MLTETNGASALRSRRVSEARKKRRADGTPYGAAGSAHQPLSDDEDASHDAQSGEKRGFFSRLVSFLPIVGKLVPEEDETAGADQVMAEDFVEEVETVDLIEDDDEDDDEEDVADDAHREGEVTETAEAEQTTVFVASNGQPRDEDVESVGSETVRGPPPALDKASPNGVEVEIERSSSAGKKRTAHSPTTAHNPQETSPSHPVRSRRVKSPSRDRSVDKSDMGPAVRPQRKRNEQRAFLPAPSQKSKMLRISANRRRKSSSPSPSDSAKTLIKQKKTISYAEYERLSRQLRELVEPTPQSALALTKNALEEGLEERGSPNGSSYVPGSISAVSNGSAGGSAANQAVLRLQNGEDSGVSLTFRKRIGVNDHRPITFSGPAMRYAHEERLDRRPRPSRLLTGSKRDATSRSAYSAAVAEKILSTLNKIQNPLEREAKKPTPSTSLSWAKYHLALVDEVTATSRGEDEKRDQENPPPTSALPRVPVSKTQPSSKAAFGTSASDVTMQDVISITASPPRSLAKTVTMGEFTFTLPRKTLGRVDEDEDMSIQFEFSPPPALREPPKKTSSSTSRLTTGTAAPFSFMPPSPKEKAEWTPKSVTPKKPAAAPKAQESASKPTTAAAAAPVSSGSNPLARFMQVAAGTWKCPTCAVANEDKYSKCPCCETAKPGASGVSAKPAAPAPAVSSGSSNPLARFMQTAPGTWKCPTCAVSNQDKFSKCPCCETAKPGGSSVSSTSTSAPTTSSTAPSSGFSFGVSSGASTSAPGSITPGGFSFGAPPSTDKSATTTSSTSGGFSFGLDPSSEKPTSDASASSSGFSFGFSASEKKDETKPKTPIENKASGFSFGVPAEKKKEAVEKLSFSFSAPVKDAGATTVDADSAKSPVPAFTFSAPTTTVKAPSTQPTFSFNASTATPASFGEVKSTKRKADESSRATEKPSNGFSFGVMPTESAKASDEAKTSESGRPSKKRIAPAMTTEKQPAAPAFAFGSPAPESSTKPPATTFGGSFEAASSSSPSTSSVSFGAAKSDEKKPTSVSFAFGSTPAPSTSGISFGASTDAKTSSPAASSTSSAPSTGFTFGAPAKADAAAPSKPAVTFGVPSTESKPAVSFGATASSSSNDKPSFAFGQSGISSSVSSSSLTTFGSSSTPTTASGFGFTPISSATSAAPSSTPAVSSSAPSFTFGSSSSQPPASSASDTSMSSSGFGVASSNPSPAFGQSSTTSAFGQTSSARSPAFGQTSSAPSPAFGQSTNASSPAFGQTANASSPAFGQSTSAPAFGQAPSPAFGQTSAQPSTTFGSAAGFRSISPAPTQTTTFGVGAAGASTSPSFGFGSSSQAASAPAAQQSFGFGAAPATTFGASAGASGFGSAPAAPAISSGFGTGFGSAPSAATAFGSQTPAAPAFGAPNPSTTFGTAPAFGSAPSGFGAPAPTAGGFGAAPAAAAPAFGAPAPAFGAAAPAGVAFGAPAPAAGGFGAPQTDNSFSMGAAPPQHAKGRRILRARARRAN